MNLSFITLFLLSCLSLIPLLVTFVSSEQQDNTPPLSISDILDSPYHPFCKPRLSADEFKWIRLYEAQLQTIEPGQRLVKLLFDSLAKDESRNKYRHGGYKVVQNDDRRM